MANISEVSEKVRGMIADAAFDGIGPKPEEMPDVRDGPDGHDMDWDGPGWYGLFRFTGTQYLCWMKVPDYPNYRISIQESDDWKRSFGFLKIKEIESLED